MDAASPSLRRPGIVVYLAGLGTSLLALWAVELLNKNGTNIMGWYANGILPVGAMIVGVGSGVGYAVASRLLQVKLVGTFIAGMVVTALVDYLAAQYLTYTNLLDQIGAGPDQYTFLQFVRDSCEKMSFSRTGAKEAGGELGMFGYVFKLLELGGYILGATLPSLIVSGLSYCKACQKYLKKHRTGFLNSPAQWADIKGLNAVERDTSLQSALMPLLEHAGELTQKLAAGSLQETEALLATCDTAAAPGTAAHVSILLEKCPACDAHVVKLKLVNYGVDKRVATSDLHKLEKLEVAQGNNVGLPTAE